MERSLYSPPTRCQKPMPLLAFRRIAPVILLAPSLACAGAFDPLPVYNQSPLVQIFGLPAFEGPRVLAAGRLQTRLSLEAASHFLERAGGAEALMLDGETRRAALTNKYGTSGADWGIEIPYMGHDTGSLDGFIERWHEFFGLPQGGRDQSPRNQLRYTYERDGVERLRIVSATSGVGDIRLLAGRSLGSMGKADVALRASLKLPTGDAAALHGSGATDVALWLAAGCAPAHCPGAWGWNATGGVLVLGRGDVLPELQRRAGAFGGVGAGWRPWAPLILKAELRAHSPFYRDTALTALGRTAVQLILGGTWIANERTMLDIGVSEDIRVGTAPDVSFLLSLRSNF